MLLMALQRKGRGGLAEVYWEKSMFCWCKLEPVLSRFCARNNLNRMEARRGFQWHVIH
jgi:hypothetical protein